MGCEKIKELILTDYIDNEMNDEEKIRLNIHLSHCRGCKDFFETVEDTAVKPFAGAKKIEPEKIEPPEFVWQRIKKAIIAKQQKKSGFVAGVLEKLKSVFYMPRPAWAISTVTVLALIAVLTATLKFIEKETLKNKREDQAEYFSYSIEAPVSAFLNNDGGFGTSVEEYFL